MEFGIDLYSLSIIGLGLALGAFVKGLTGGAAAGRSPLHGEFLVLNTPSW